MRWVYELRVLDLDLENRPLAYWYDGATTAEVTAIAAGFIGGRIKCWLLGPNTMAEMLEGFRKMYDAADMVTGHNIRGHDLPIINGALIEIGHRPLGPKLTSDTNKDRFKTKDFSWSQENISQTLGLSEDKSHMSNASWREANRLVPRGLRLTRARAIGDVKQHMALRARMIRLGLLGAPKMWRPR